MSLKNEYIIGTQLSGNTISGTTIYSGSTNLSNIFVLSGQNLGAGYGIFTGKTGGDLFFKTLSAGTNVTLTSDGNVVMIAASVVGGSATGVQGGTNTYTGGTFSNPSVNVSALTINTLTASGNSVFSGTLSGGSSFSANTLFSGSTNLYNLFVNHLRDGTNTYTGGTVTNPSVNVSALTINTLTASGATSLATISATTYYSGSSELSTIFNKKETVYTSIQQIYSGTTAIAANNLTVNLTTGKKYLLSGVITISGATGGGRFGLSGSTAPSINTMFFGTTSAINAFQGHLTKINGLIAAQTVASSSAIHYQQIQGMIDCTGSTGTLSLVYRAISGGNNICIEPYSYLTIEEL